MKGIVLSVVVAIATCLAPPAQAQEPRFTASAASPFKRVAFVNGRETRFSGSATLSGTFEVHWEPASDMALAGYRTTFRPDAHGRALLPHPTGSEAVHELWFRNGETALNQLISPAQKKALQTAPRSLTGSVTITLTALRSSVDCDRRHYNAQFTARVAPPSGVVVAPLPDDAAW